MFCRVFNNGPLDSKLFLCPVFELVAFLRTDTNEMHLKTTNDYYTLRCTTYLNTT